MVAEVVESKLGSSTEAGSEENASIGLHLPVKFGSDGLDEPLKVEGNKVADANFPKDAEKEWPAPVKAHNFFFIRYRSFEDQKLKAKLDQLDKELLRKNQFRSQLIEKLRAKKNERGKIISQVRALDEEKEEFQASMDKKKKEIEPFQQALGQLRGGGNGGRDGKSVLCSSEKELNDLIKGLQYHIQHESLSLSEEKQILREIKQLEATREKVVENAAARAKIQQLMGEKEVLQDQVKLIGVEMKSGKNNRELLKARIRDLWKEKKALDQEIVDIEEELTAATENSTKLFESIRELRKQREAANTCFYQYRSLLTKAKDLAIKKDVQSLRHLSETEATKFISEWSNNKAFREDYEMRILSSLDFRQLSRDGRIRNPGEKPIVPAVKSEDSKIPKQDDTQPLQKVEKEKKEAKQPKVANIKKKERKELYDLEDEFFIPEVQRNSPPKVEVVDERKLKEKRREEEIAKAKQALERKKRLAEKAAAKAAARVQKEAEKKEKECEKRMKKKAGTNVAAPEPVEQTEESETTLAEKLEESVKDTSPQKKTESKENVIRYKRPPHKGLHSPPKTLLKRKKSDKYWMWAAAASVALALVSLLVIFGSSNLRDSSVPLTE